MLSARAHLEAHLFLMIMILSHERERRIEQSKGSSKLLLRDERIGLVDSHTLKTQRLPVIISYRMASSDWVGDGQ